MRYDKSTPAAKNTSKVRQSGFYSTQNSQNITNCNQSGSCLKSIPQHISDQISDINITPKITQTKCLRSDKYLIKIDISNSTGTNIFLEHKSIE